MGDVLTVVAKIHPKVDKADEVQAILVQMADAVRRAEPDCLVYRPHRLQQDPVVFLFYEQYRSESAFDAHRTAPHLAGFREQLRPLLSRATEVEVYRSLTD